MTEKTIINPISSESPTTKETEGPLLLEIKAAVEKLAGDVRSLSERMNKQDEEKAKKPSEYPALKIPKKKEDMTPEELLASEAEEKAKKPLTSLLPPSKKKEVETTEEEKAKKPIEPYPPKKKEDEKQDAHGCNADEEWDETAGQCVPKTSKQAKPEKYPYPEGGASPCGKKSSQELINEQMKNLQEEVTGLRKCLGMPAIKRTEVVKKEDFDTPLDVSKMSWPQLNELARPVDIRRMGL